MQIRVNRRMNHVSLDNLYGIFFEDINHAADGGLYAEMVQNRAFAFDKIDNKDYHALTAWELRGVTAEIMTRGSMYEDNPTYARVSGHGSIVNEGFCGIALKEGESYALTVTARGKGVKVTLESKEGEVYAQTAFSFTDEWGKYSAELVSSATDNDARLAVYVDGREDIDCVSLFPKKTYKGGVWREDLAKMLEDMRPDFVRFPGGCLVHDGSLNPDDRDALYFWKNSVSKDPFARPPRRNNWGYNQTLGLGYYEYFLLCEHLGAKPLPVLAAGFNVHRKIAAPLSEMAYWVSDALDLIEFANGPVTTHYGALRASLGHEEPFNLEYLAIGNEELGYDFFDRYPLFKKAIEEKYPNIKLISTAGPFANGADFNRFWTFSNEMGAYAVDEHYYQTPRWFLNNMHRYDSYARGKSKVFLGEYASWGSTLYNAVVEAAYMCHMEQNADVVALSCYAPLFCNKNYVNWQPDLIWFDNHSVCAIPSYYVQKLFMNNKGDTEIECKIIDNILIEGSEEPIALNFEMDTRGGECTLLSSKSAGCVWCARVKKNSGSRGIDIVFGKEDDKNYYKLEIGGWANDMVCVGQMSDGVYSGLMWGDGFTVETDREYDVEIEIIERRIICSVDGRKIIDFTPEPDKYEGIHACASLDGEDIILKVVNVLDRSVTSAVNALGKSALVTTLTGGKDDTNTLAEPKKIYPTERRVALDGDFSYEFPPYSLTIFRFD